MKNRQGGQALVESVMANVILFLLAYGSLEIARLLAYKSLMKVAATEAAMSLSHRTLELIKAGAFDGQALPLLLNSGAGVKLKAENEDIIRSEIESFLSGMPLIDTLSFEPNKAMVTRAQSEAHIFLENPAGIPLIRVTLQSCLPVLFTKSYRAFPKFKGVPDAEIGVQDEECREKTTCEQPTPRDCRGWFGESWAEFEFNLKTEVSLPVPASAQLFIQGTGREKEIDGLSPAPGDFLFGFEQDKDNSYARVRDAVYNARLSFSDLLKTSDSHSTHGGPQP